MSAFGSWLIGIILAFIYSKLEAWGLNWWTIEQNEQQAQADADKDEKAIAGSQTDSDRAQAAAGAIRDSFK